MPTSCNLFYDEEEEQACFGREGSEINNDTQTFCESWDISSTNHSSGLTRSSRSRSAPAEQILPEKSSGIIGKHHRRSQLSSLSLPPPLSLEESENTHVRPPLLEFSSDSKLSPMEEAGMSTFFRLSDSRSGSVSLETQNSIVKLRRAGQGASGSVFQAVHMMSLELLALKEVRLSGCRDDSALKQLQMEAKALEPQRTPLMHSGPSLGRRSSTVFTDETCPYIVKYHGFIRAEDVQAEVGAIVLEWVGEGTLLKWASEDMPMPEPLVAHIAFCICSALVCLTDWGMVHQDLKPANVLLAKVVREDGSLSMDAKLVDFGTSGRTDECSDPEEGNKVMGTMRYMAPERLTLSPPDHAGDVFSLGVTLATLVNQGICPIAQGHGEFEQLGYALSAGKSFRDWGRQEEGEGVWASGAGSPSNWNSPRKCPYRGVFMPGVPSLELRSFLSECCQADPSNRPSAEELLSHPFLAQRHGWEQAHPEVMDTVLWRRSMEGRYPCPKDVAQMIVDGRTALGIPIISAKSFSQCPGFPALASELGIPQTDLLGLFDEVVTELDMPSLPNGLSRRESIRLNSSSSLNMGPELGVLPVFLSYRTSPSFDTSLSLMEMCHQSVDYLPEPPYSLLQQSPSL
jgi:serine/threonine protein kinase